MNLKEMCQVDSSIVDICRCYYCHHSRHGHGHLECCKCKVSSSGVRILLYEGSVQGGGRVGCHECEGSGELCCFVQLSIAWTPHTEDCFIGDKQASLYLNIFIFI